MCKLKFACLVIPLVLSFCKSSNAQIIKEQAIDSVLVNIVADDSLNYNVYLYPEICGEDNFDIAPYLNVQNPYDSAWVFFVDLFPEKGWGHRCKYVIVDKVTGQFTISNDNLPPRLYWLNWDEISVPFPHQVVIQSTDTIVKSNSEYKPDPNKYALLITWNAWEDTARWNNLSHIYTGLKLAYGFSDENIFVLSDDGVFDRLTMNLDLDHLDNYCDFDGPCTKDSIEDILSFLQSELDDDDLFFFYVTTHGDTLDGDKNDTTALVLWDTLLWDYELEEMMQSIHCSQKIFCIDACYAGGFVEELSGNHSVVNVPATRDVETLRCWRYFDFFSYAWGTAIRGKHPKDAIEPYYAIYNIGEHPDLTQVYPTWDKPDTIPDLLSFGGNEDGYIQLGEAFNYAKYIDGQTLVSGREYNNDGFKGDLLTLNGIEGRVDTSQEISGSFLMGRKLTIAPDVVLSDNSNLLNPLNLYLNDSTEILVEDGSTLNINGYYTKFNGCSGHSFVNIEGNISQTYMNFIADNGATIHMNFDNPSKSYVLSGFNFKNAGIQASCNQLKFTLADFDHSPIEFSGNRLELNQSDLVSGSDIVFTGYEQFILDSNDLTDCSLDLNLGNISIKNDNDFINSSITIGHPINEAAYIDIIGNDFDNDSTVTENAVITIEDYRNFRIDSNNFRYARGRGIELFNAGWDGREVQQIAENAIELKQPSTSVWSDVGINVYCSKAN